MKINRFLAIAVIVLLMVGAMGLLGMKAFAQGNTSLNHQASVQPQDCPQDQTEGSEVQDASPDTDNVEVQCGDQSTPDGQETTGRDTEDTTDSETVVHGTPSITIDQAQTAALAVHPGTIIKMELDEENGQLIYNVEINDGVNIKVDAMTGTIFAEDSGQD
jgi:uncharacterized membrane protein YkoI